MSVTARHVSTKCHLQVMDIFDELTEENHRLCKQLSLAHKLCQLVDQFRDNLNDFYNCCECDTSVGPKTVYHHLQDQYKRVCDEIEAAIASSHSVTTDDCNQTPVNPIHVFVDNILNESPDKMFINRVLKTEVLDNDSDIDVDIDDNGSDRLSTGDQDDRNDSSRMDHRVVLKTRVNSRNKPGRQVKTRDLDENRTKCEECLRVFASSHQLSKHIRRTHRELFDRKTKKFICSDSGCGLQFKKFSQLVIHKNRHSGDKQFKCADTHEGCEWTFFTAGELRNHQIACHLPQQLFHCDWIGCNESFKIKTDLDLHKTYKHNDSESNLQLWDTSDDAFNSYVPDKTFLKHDFNSNYSVIKNRRTNNIMRYICNYIYCDFKSVGNERIVDHIQRLHFNKIPMKCEECVDMFWTQKELINHIRPNHSNLYDRTKRMFKCNQCTLEFDKYSKLLIHRNRHFGEKKFKCWDQFPDCKWSFFTIGELKNHQLWSHSKEQNFVCDWSDCGKKFKLRNLLESHKLIHTGEQPFKCIWPGCDSKFVREQALRVHMTSHTGLKTFVCDWPECGHSFRSNANLRMHYTSHTNDRRYECEWPGCESRFLNKVQLRRHYLCHKSEGDFACTWDNCNKKLKTKFSLRIHLMAHKGERPVKCAANECDMRFTEKSQMRKHFKRKHLNIRVN